MPGDLRWRWRLCPTRSDFPRPPEPASGLDALRERRPPARGGKARTQRPTLVQKLGGDVGQLASQRRGLGAFDDSQERVGGRRRSPAVPHPFTPPPPPLRSRPPGPRGEVAPSDTARRAARSARKSGGGAGHHTVFPSPGSRPRPRTGSQKTQRDFVLSLSADNRGSECCVFSPSPGSLWSRSRHGERGDAFVRLTKTGKLASQGRHRLEGVPASLCEFQGCGAEPWRVGQGHLLRASGGSPGPAAALAGS